MHKKKKKQNAQEKNAQTVPFVAFVQNVVVIR